MIVFDACVLIAYLDGDDVHHHDAETLLTEAVDDEFGVNPLTLAEVLVAPVRAGRLDATIDALDELDVREVPFPEATAVRLARLRVSSGLKMPDCCVLLTAQDRTATVASFDDRLRRAAKAIDLTVIPV